VVKELYSVSTDTDGTPSVAGDNTVTPHELEQNALVLLQDTLENGHESILVGFLCDTVRFARACQKVPNLRVIML
jgi:hypothetical protein